MRSDDELLTRLERLPAVAAVLDGLGAGFVPSVLAVGGAVRDLLLGGEPQDLDLVVDGPVDGLARRLGGEARHHGRFATARVDLAGRRYDLAQSRRETYAHPGALPDVAPAPIEDDLERRDFTVNAIAFGLTGPRQGELLAVPRALADLDRRRLRVLHAASFEDDPTRLLRLARYRARLGFEIEPETLALARTAIAGDALATVSGNRIGQELRLLARETDPVAAFASVAALGIDRAIDLRLGLDDPDLARRALELLPPDGRRELLVLALAAGGLDAAALDRLGLSAVERQTVAGARARAGQVAAALERAQRPSEIARAVGAAPVELVALSGALGPRGPARSWLANLRDVGLAIDGSDLLAAGLAPGPAIGAGLAAARAAALDGEAPDRATQLAEALRAARQSD